jgi:ADP-ribose pyrophosphatase
MIFEEKTISSDRIYEGKILNLRRDKIIDVRGKASYREIVEHGGGVAIAAVTEENRMILVRQFRKAAEKAILEVPAGKIEKGEDPIMTAARELKEETGYTAAKLEHITSFYSSVGYSEEVIHLYYAKGLSPGETDFDDNEAIDIEEYDVARLKRMVLEGEIEDAKTVAAILIVAAKEGK